MALACSECGHKLELSDADRCRLAGKFFACPECGTSKRLPLMPTKPETVRLSAESPEEIFARLAIEASPSPLQSKTRKLKPGAKAAPAAEQATPAVESAWITAEQIIDESARERKRSWWRRMPLVKRLMLIVTGLWPVFWAFFAHASAKGSFGRYRYHGEDSFFDGHGGHISVSEAWSRSLSTGIFVGGFAATVIYAGLMFVLLVVWFCTKKDSSASRE